MIAQIYWELSTSTIKKTVEVCPDCIHKCFSYSFTELQVILWPRTNAVFTCSCRMKVLTGTTFPEKYGSRVFQTGTREGHSSVVRFYSHSAAYKVQSNLFLHRAKSRYLMTGLGLFNRSCFVHVSLYTHIVFLYYLNNVLVSLCVCII